MFITLIMLGMMVIVMLSIDSAFPPLPGIHSRRNQLRGLIIFIRKRKEVNYKTQFVWWGPFAISGPIALLMPSTSFIYRENINPSHS
jgi:hypothetical protein